jgi:uncharacterized protein YdaU (DUF1376 family)
MRRDDEEALNDIVRDIIANMPEPEPSMIYIDPEKYLEITADLSLEEQGAYAVLRMFTLKDGRKILEDEEKLCRVIGCTRHRWRNKLSAKVLPLLDLNSGDMS